MSQAPAAVFAAARAAFSRHRGLGSEARLAAISCLKRSIVAGREQIVARLVSDLGKCRTDALIAEILGTVDWLQWLERHAAQLLGVHKVPTPLTLLGKKSLLCYEPLGVVLVICPWNYPFHNAITAIAAAVVCGNAVVYKPSEHSPCTGLIEGFLAASPLLQDLVHIVYGDGAVGRDLIAAGPEKIFFTGSGKSGAAIMAQAAQQLIPVELELGGKDALVVFADANQQRSVAAALWGACTNAGQSCSGVERLLVEDRVVERFTERLVQEAGLLVVAASGASHVDIGRMTVAFQRDKVLEHVEDAIAKGARLRFGQLPSRSSLVVTPIILDQVRPDMLVWREETFGPVLPVMAFSSEEEAIRLANDTDYGLCASVFSGDKHKALRVARALEVGGVSINNVNMSEGNPGLPFGGAKKSGFGKLRGVEGLRGFTRSKAVLVDRDASKIEANWYPYTAGKFARFERFIDALYQPRWNRLARTLWHGLRLESFSQKSRRQAAGDPLKKAPGAITAARG